MTEQEKQEIINELEKRFEKYNATPRKQSKEDINITLKSPRNKWFRDDCGNGRTRMHNAFGDSVTAWQLWETIRKLTCVVCGKQYIKQIRNVKDSEIICERICQFIYYLRMEFLENEKKEVVSNENY